MGRGGCKKCKPILIPPYEVDLKSRLISVLPPLQDGKKSCRAKREETDQVGRGKIVIPTCESMLDPHIVGEMAKKRQMERKKDPKNWNVGRTQKKAFT